jgi:hypothetical protein
MPLPEPIIQSLRSAMAERRLVAYHKWGDDPTIFLVGFIEEVKSDRILFDQVGTQGEPENEIDVVDMESIQQLDFDSDYLRGLEKLFAVYDELIGKKPSAGIRATRHADIVKNFQSAKNSGEAVLTMMTSGRA